jgi:hypothetical protein
MVSPEKASGTSKSFIVVRNWLSFQELRRLEVSLRLNNAEVSYEPIG